MKVKWVVRIEDNMWLTDWIGDPGRTTVKFSAKKYKTELGAKIALGIARRHRPLKNARIMEAKDES